MLGWTPEQALLTPIPWLKLAIDGRVEWECRKNGKEPPKARKRQSAPDPEKVQQQIKAAFGGLARRNERKQKAATAG